MKAEKIYRRFLIEQLKHNSNWINQTNKYYIEIEKIKIVIYVQKNNNKNIYSDIYFTANGADILRIKFDFILRYYFNKIKKIVDKKPNNELDKQLIELLPKSFLRKIKIDKI